jgi:hypothetical protein
MIDAAVGWTPLATLQIVKHLGRPVKRFFEIAENYFAHSN